jgi:hypothetical protein
MAFCSDSISRSQLTITNADGIFHQVVTFFSFSQPTPNTNTAAKDVMKMLAQNVTGIIVPNSGHYIQEEQPDVVVKLLNNFFSGNSTTSNK